MRLATTGGVAFAEMLRDAGVRTVFGVAGTQNLELLEGLRKAELRMVTASSELTAAFMANGHARVSRRAAILTTIPGPGFTFALPGIAEARLDHVPLVWVCLAPEPNQDGRRALQEIPQVAIAGPLVKAVLRLSVDDDAGATFQQAVRIAEEGEPGPVLLHVDPAVLRASRGDSWNPTSGTLVGSPPLRVTPPSREVMEEAVRMVGRARRPLLYAGAGTLDAAGKLREVAEGIGCPIVTTTSARGVVPEDHPLSLASDFPGCSPDALNALFQSADLVLACGCAMTHNGTHGFRLDFRAEDLLWVSSRPGGPPPPFSAQMVVEADVRTFLDNLGVALRSNGRRKGGWSGDELSRWRTRLEAESRRNASDDPPVQGTEERRVGMLFGALREALPPESILVTDSGRHQMLARRYFRVLSPNGLIVPSDFQSMGFGIPAAIGAKLAAPGRPVVALVGDGAFQVTGSELLSAMREGLGITTIVLRDDELGLIAESQRRRFGITAGTRVHNPDYALLSAAYGARYLTVDDDPERTFGWAIRGDGPALVEVRLGRSRGSRLGAAKSVALNAADRAIGVGSVRRLFGGG